MNSIQLIRHATLKITYMDRILLVDPMLSSRGTMSAVPNSANELMNPLVELPFSKNRIINDIDAVIITHTHRDHLDEEAILLMDKGIPIFCQPEDEGTIKMYGFKEVIPIKNQYNWGEIKFRRTKGRHGRGKIGDLMGPVSGFIIEGQHQPRIYIAGDTVWCQEVRDVLEQYRPDQIVVNGGAAQFLTGGLITMGCEDIVETAKFEPHAKVLVTHMEAWNHCLLRRKELQKALEGNHVRNVRILENGELFVCS